MTIYLDHNATTQPDDAVVAAMLPVLRKEFGNAAAQHRGGRAAANRVRAAAESVAQLLGVSAGRLIWTSGATESLGTAIRAAAQTHPHLISAVTEHRAVLDSLEYHRAQGGPMAWAELNRQGLVDPAALTSVLETVQGRATVVLSAANNETGVLNDIPTLTEITHEHGGVFVCDATQAVGKIPVDLSSVDFAACSAHKLYGPQGVGVLVVPRGVPAMPLIHGGGHQRGWRSGTLNLPGIVGLGAAASVALELLDSEPQRQSRLRDLLEQLLEESVGETHVNGGGAPRLPNTLNIRLPGVPAEALITRCPDLLFSTGSACTSSVPHPSHVLTGMGFDEVHAEESIRLSIGRTTSTRDIRCAVDELTEAATAVRQLMQEAS
ncbi:MAG: cysteine desulfurase family protein [Dehalococcoidia bacterium]